MNCKFSHYKCDMMLVLSHLSASRQQEDNICVCSLNARVFGGSSFPRVIRRGCCQAARGSQQELTFTTPRHTSQTPVSLKHSLCGRPNITTNSLRVEPSHSNKAGWQQAKASLFFVLFTIRCSGC